MQNLQNENGFTLLHALFTLFIISIIFQSLPAILQQLSIYNLKNHTKSLEVYQFFHFVNEELYTASTVTPILDGVQINKQNGDNVEIERYGKIIRRQVNKQGHEWLLNDVDAITVKQSKNGFILSLEMTNGEMYEKFFILYPP